MGTQPVFKPWEIKDNNGRLKVELAMRDTSTVVIELLHSASFRNTGLGNTIFVPAHHVGKLSSETVSCCPASFIYEQIVLLFQVLSSIYLKVSGLHKSLLNKWVVDMSGGLPDH